MMQLGKKEKDGGLSVKRGALKRIGVSGRPKIGKTVSIVYTQKMANK